MTAVAPRVEGRRAVTGPTPAGECNVTRYGRYTHLTAAIPAGVRDRSDLAALVGQPREPPSRLFSLQPQLVRPRLCSGLTLAVTMRSHRVAHLDKLLHVRQLQGAQAHRAVWR
jgi:hypothetical protein